jgi:mRNA interferase MazF
MAKAKDLAAPRRGEVWLAELDKRRPVVVLTRDPLARLLNAVVIAPITSTVRGISTEVSVGSEVGITKRSVINLDNMQRLHRAALVRRVGAIPPTMFDEVCEAANDLLYITSIMGVVANRREVGSQSRSASRRRLCRR